MRASGILLPIFSLPSEYGIGCFSKEAYEFVDFLKASGQKYWQILPLGPTGFGASPYQSYSTFAGNPYFIDVTEFEKLGYVTKADLEKYDATGTDLEKIDYGLLEERRMVLLKKAFENSGFCAQSGSRGTDVEKFCKKEAFWLEDYALFMALKNAFSGKSWNQWDEKIRLRHEKALRECRKKYSDDIEFYKFIQFFFWKQWTALKKYANESGVEIIGDIPIYVAFDSADTWAFPELFDLNEDNVPNNVAGCPPDFFSATGQLWGNPLYDWEYHKKTGYSWWLKRVGKCFELVDGLRIDHFRGFDEFWSIPYGDPTAEFGKWLPGPGYELFATIKKNYGKKMIIAEDLGLITDSVRKLVKKTGYPGMKVLQFAFGGADPKNEYLPQNCDKNYVIYTGTHDNDTTRGWYRDLQKNDKKALNFFKKYSGCKREDKAAECMTLMAMTSVADTCIILMQDYLNLPESARINTPSTVGCNWSWRMKKDALSDKLSLEIKKLTKLSNRMQ